MCPLDENVFGNIFQGHQGQYQGTGMEAVVLGLTGSFTNRLTETG